MATNRVDLIDKDDARGILLALLEHVAHAACAHAHEHFDEIRTRDGEEGHVRLTSDGARQQRLTSARWADQQDALGNLAAEALELLRIAKEVDNLLKLGLRLLDAGNVLEGDTARLLGQQLGL